MLELLLTENCFSLKYFFVTSLILQSELQSLYNRDALYHLAGSASSSNPN
jgi:hypothetical protein